ncbi:hypothetical protein [Streptomyces sp. NPDC006193]|uniref:hypothetical protein n=1 Tax=Streptomyces sp. NPDC006193 TaxID=3155717 RepID=UPI0033AD0DE8
MRTGEGAGSGELMGARAGGVADAAGEGARPGGGRRSRGRVRGGRRARRVAVGSLAGVAAFCLALGLGRLVTGAGDSAGGGAAARSAADAGGKAAGDAAESAEPERVLACSRLVVEGTVARVRRERGSPSSRVTLTVLRSYKPAHGPAEVGFLLDGDAEPAPRVGQHVLVRVARGEETAGLWAVGDARVAEARARITDALAGSRHTSCS